MRMTVPRTVTVFAGDRNPSPDWTLESFRDTSCYVLLGGPGAGRTTAFKLEAGRGDDSLYVRAREFIRFHADPKPEWRGKTLFIDGLDEVRAGSQDLRQPLDQILIGLERLGTPPARISCRSTAWLVVNDGEAVKSLPGYEHPVILSLDPLTKQGTRDILVDHMGYEADSFLAEAYRRSLDGLLDNPLSLDLLIKVVGPGKGWPESRTETFERACLAMLAEENPEHAAANRQDPVPEQDAFAAAGRMAALLLLADKDGIAWDRTDVSDLDNLLLIAEILEEDTRSIHRARDSGLFVTQAPGKLVPVHPHVAEYLTARHLAWAIKGGAAVRRVLTLLTSYGGVPSPLRGVVAWLAALCPDARRRLVDIDPMGVVAYGDVAVFNEHERDHLLSRLANDDGLAHRLSPFPIPGLGGLVSPQTMNKLRDCANGSDRSEPAQRTMELLLRGLAAAPSRGGGSISGKDLIAIAGDTRWPLDVRIQAVKAATSLPRKECDPALQLDLLRDVNDEDDPHGDLRTLLILELYPKHVTPENVWNWIPFSLPPHLPGGLLHRSSPDHCRALLDGLRTKHADHFLDPSLARLAWKILGWFIKHGGTVGVTKLYHWLELAARDPTGWNQPDHADSHAVLLEMLGDPGRPASGARRVQEWLAQQPSRQKELLLEFFGQDRLEGKSGLEVASEAQQFWLLISDAGRPDGCWEWCLKQALAMSGTVAEAARWLIERAVEPIRRSAATDERFATGFESICEDLIPADQSTAIAMAPKQHVATGSASTPRDGKPGERAWADEVLKHRDALLQGTGPGSLMVRLGNAYWGTPFNNQSRTGEERLREALAPSQDAAEVALQALSTVPTTDVGSSIVEIARTDSTGRAPSWGWPYLAGLDVIDRRGGNVLEIIGENLNRALWFYFATPLDCEMPPWFDKVLRARPDKVANVIVDLHRHRIRSKLDNASTLSAMADDDRYCEATKMALPDLLRAFPAKGYGAQLEMLRHVLALAVRHMPDKVVARVRDRMTARGMNAAQRATWLGAGVAVAPSEFVPDAVAFLERGRAPRAQHLIEALHSVWKARKGPLFNPGTRAPAVAELVRILGAKRPPLWDGPEISGPIFPVFWDKGSELAEHLVDCLASNPTHEAGLELESLLTNQKLADWHNTIRSALERQRILHHDTEYTVPSVKHVQQVLAGGPPADAADLVALVVDQLERVGNYIRHGSTDDWRQYWNDEVREGGRVTPPRPKQEKSCRDALLSALNKSLPREVDVDARREGSYAGNTSADIRVRYGSFGIPIEVKKSNHRELWSAMRNQLMAKYARDPESAWHGVYVVLWFGANGAEPVKTPPTGPRPKDPGELARRLEEDLSPAERSRVKVVVIDVSWPDGSSSGAPRPSRAGRRQEFRSPRT